MRKIDAVAARRSADRTLAYSLPTAQVLGQDTGLSLCTMPCMARKGFLSDHVEDNLNRLAGLAWSYNGSRPV